MNDAIQTQMAVPVAERNVDWLKTSLQAAIELELSTLPPYLFGMWSIRNSNAGGDGAEAAGLIDLVVRQEMSHMGLVCNLLTAIGGTPEIAKGYRDNIHYPGHLPGNVRPELTVYLSGLTKPYVREVYMEIEYPENGPLVLMLESVVTESFATIGEFYDAVLEAFENNAIPFDGSRQLVSNTLPGLAVTPITSIGNVRDAIRLIKEQGEGTPNSPAQNANGELAHYYRFAELYLGLKLMAGPQGGLVLGGAPFPFPDTITVPRVPVGGYEQMSAEVQGLQDSFNGKFSRMLDQLDLAWQTGAASHLGMAVRLMFGLKPLARQIMAKPLPQALEGFYGPTFIYLPAVEEPAPVGPELPVPVPPPVIVAGPVFADVIQLLKTLVGPGPSLGFSPHGSFWDLGYDTFVAQKTDNWGVAGQLVVKGDPAASVLYQALAGTGSFPGTVPQMPDTDLSNGSRHASAAELEIVAAWITNNCPK